MTESDVVVELWVRHEGAMICVLLDQAGGVDALEEWLNSFDDFNLERFQEALDAIGKRLNNVNLGKIPFFEEFKGYRNPPLFEIKRGKFRLLCHRDHKRIIIVHWDRKGAKKLRRQDLDKAHKRTQLVKIAIEERRLRIVEQEN